ncbi:MAG: diguanylate cyclase [Betaproteobacteria bacterium]|nr:diguanylate cyclase [Betaproteobacteria bacterium]
MREIRFEDEEPGERSREEGLRFARRMYAPRFFGLALGALCIAGGLWQQGANAFEWALLALNAFGWPHLAYRLAIGSRNPHRAEVRNLMVDSASGGLWIALLHFNPAPSVVLFAMLAMDKAAVGGVRLLVRCLAVQAFVIAIVTLLVGFEMPVESSVEARVAVVPLLLVYSITVALSAYRLSRRVRQQAIALAALSSTDELTGLLNQGHWKRAVLAEFHRFRRLGGHATLLMIDIDRFKEVNDRHGHPAGDRVIRAVAELIRNNVRAHDVPGRYGGDEFSVLLPGADENATRFVAERIRARAASLHAGIGEPITVSVGFAVSDPADANPDAWLARADAALYRAKAAGRNRVEQSGSSLRAA